MCIDRGWLVHCIVPHRFVFPALIAVSKLYRKKSGLIAPHASGPTLHQLDPMALLSRNRSMTTGRVRIMGDSLQRKFSSTAPSNAASPVQRTDRSIPSHAALSSPVFSGSAGGLGLGTIDAQRTYISTYIGAFASTGVRTHFELLDSVYYGEIHSRYEAVMASGAVPKAAALVGVKPAARPGGGTRYIARVTLSQVCVHLGSFGTYVEAAVAFDYGTTYIRGGVVPSINFPGSASDCRVNPPMDPWPISIQEAIAQGRLQLPSYKALPGEETRFTDGPGPQAAAALHAVSEFVAPVSKRRRAAPSTLCGGDFEISLADAIPLRDDGMNDGSDSEHAMSDIDEGADERLRGGDDDEDGDEELGKKRQRKRSGAVVPFVQRYAQEAASGSKDIQNRSDYIGVSLSSNIINTRWCARTTSNGSIRQIGTYDSQV